MHTFLKCINLVSNALLHSLEGIDGCPGLSIRASWGGGAGGRVNGLSTRVYKGKVLALRLHMEKEKEN